MVSKTQEQLDKLKERFINGEISESTYLELKQELEVKISSESGGEGLSLDETSSTLSLLTPGIQLGDYKVERLIGRGAFGVVYQVLYSGLDRPVKRAIKTIPMEVASSPKALESLKREVRIAQELGHPHIVRTYSLEEETGNIFFVMEYIEGMDLGSYLDAKEGRRVDTAETVKLLSGVAEALDYAHSLTPKVVHRDLKPENLLFDPRDNRLKISDFGLAREVADSMSRLSRQSMSSGTPAYMPFEQFMGATPAPTMDIYALGIIAHEMLSGEPPFCRGDVMTQHEKKQPPIIPLVPENVMHAILRALDKDPAKRYQRAKDFINDLSQPVLQPCPICGESRDSKRFTCTECGRENICIKHEKKEGVCIDCMVKIRRQKAPAPTPVVSDEGSGGGSKPPVKPVVIPPKPRIIAGNVDSERHNQAVDYYNEAIDVEDIDEKIRLNSLAIELDPYFAKAYFNRGLVYRKKEEYEKAIQDYTKAIELDTEYAYAYNNRGYVYDEIGDYDKAIVDYNRAIKLDPNYIYAYNNRGLAYYSKKNYQQAIADYNRAIELDPNYALAYNNRGNAYDSIGEFEKAISDYSRALEIDREYASAYRNRGLTYYRHGDYELAIRDYDMVLKFRPDHAYTYYDRGLAYRRLGEIKKAIRSYSKAIELKPDYAEAYNNRGNCFDQDGDYDRAIMDYDKAGRINPKDPMYYYNRGLVYKKKGDRYMARIDFKKARDLGDPDAQRELDELDK